MRGTSPGSVDSSPRVRNRARRRNQQSVAEVPADSDLGPMHSGERSRIPVIHVEQTRETVSDKINTKQTLHH